MCWKTGDNTDSLDFFFLFVWFGILFHKVRQILCGTACAVNLRFCCYYCLRVETNLSLTRANSTCILDALFLRFKLTVLLCSVKVWAVPITK